MYPDKNKSSFTKEEETGYWEVTDKLCPSSAQEEETGYWKVTDKLCIWSSAFPTVACCLCFVS